MSKKNLDEIVSNMKRLCVLEKVSVTPHLAMELMKRNSLNRPLKKRTVALYTQEMKQEAWVFNGDSIRFSKTGRLLDGQHRLAAIIESNTTQIFNIQLGLDDDTFDKMDIGKGRNATDTLAMAGYKNPAALQAAIKIVDLYDRNILKDSKVLEKVKRMSNSDILEWMEYHKEELMKECVERGVKYRSKGPFFGAGTWAAFDYMFSRKDAEASERFLSKLSTGEDISTTKEPAIYLLRQKLLNMQLTKGVKVDTTNKYALMIKAWNYYREGKDPKRLYWSPEEEFPKIK